MFESIELYRAEASSRLKQLLSGAQFPHSLLLSGPPYSGRLTLALESTRILSCQGDKTNRCTCSSCKEYTYCDFSHIIFIGTRDHQVRIDSALEIAGQQRSERALKHLYRELRMMLLQYHSSLIVSGDSKREALFSSAGELDEALHLLRPKTEKEFAPFIKEVKKLLKPLYSELKKRRAITIGQIRSLSLHLQQTSLTLKPRFVIIEGLEESSEGAKNSLLKILEEPPLNSYITLISEHPSRLLATLLSRLQHIPITPFSASEYKAVLHDEFGSDSHLFNSVEQFMLHQSGIDTNHLTSLAHTFVESVVSKKSMKRSQLEEYGSYIGEEGQFLYFMKEMKKELQTLFLSQRLSLHESRKISEISDAIYQKATLFNQNNQLLFESLYYRLAEEL